MKINFKRMFSLVFVPGVSGFPCFWQINSAVHQLRIYDYPMNPRQHPDDARRFINPQALKQLLLINLINRGSIQVLDGLFNGKDEEYRDIKTREKLKNN